MPPLNLPIKIWGRPFKPVSFSFAISMLLIVYINISGNGIVGFSSGRFFVALNAGIAAVLSIWGWISQSQKVAELALLFVAFVWAARFWAGGLTLGFDLANEGVWFSLCWSLIASGSYWLERTDARNDYRGA